MEDFYVYPEHARQKLRMAQEMNRVAYVYGVTGSGKTELVKHYLSRRKYIYLDAARDIVDKFEEEIKECSIVVVDNIQSAEPEEIREAIIRLTERKNLWLILVGRCRCPFWLVPVSIRQYPFAVIQEDDLCFSLNEVEKYLEQYGIDMDKEAAERILEDSKGYPLFLKIVVSQLLARGKDARKKGYVYDEKIFRRSQQMLWDYIDREVYDQWEPELADFVLQMCVVDSFNIRMAEEISGKRNVEEVLRKAFYTGNFLEENDGEYTFIPPVLFSMRRRLKLKYTKEQRNKLYYNAGRCYMQAGKVKEALSMFEACDDKEQIGAILIENARTNPGSGYLFELRNYYLELPEDSIRDSAELITGMCMLQSLLLNPQESERWYEILRQKGQEATGRLRQVIKSNLAYLDISLPHRGSGDVLTLLKNMGTLLKNREITLPELSVTSNAPSMMNGGKDFCEWSRRDRELAASVGKMVSFVLGKYGAGLVELALAESFFEKGEDNYEVIRLVSKGQIQAENRGKLEQCFVAAGLLCNVHILSGHTEDAKLLLSEFLEKAKRENADKMLPNIYNLFARISLYRGEKAEIEEWMKTAPGEMEDFNPFERYRYLTKIRVYLLYGKYELAEGLLDKTLVYAELMHRTYIHMECRLLLAVLQYRRGYAGWKETFQQVYTELEDYHFVRLISREGSAVLPLLKAEQWVVKDRKFMAQVLKETSAMAEYYPAYLKEQIPGEDSFPENAIRILRMQAEGMSNEQIAQQLEITAATVKYHCRQTYKKLGVNGKAAAVIEARKRKLI